MIIDPRVVPAITSYRMLVGAIVPRPIPSDIVRPPRVLESRVNMECRVIQVIEVSTLPRGGNLVLGEVVRFHVDDAVVTNSGIDPDKLRAIGRMSGSSYVRTRDRFDLIRPA
jgi:flavin reductase (DIM6/NTAB) family NADH-FMN oxidoreductase RutF